MKNQIRSVRFYSVFNSMMVDVLYESGRVFSYHTEDLPQTAKRFIKECGEGVHIYDVVYKCESVLYQHKIAE